MVPEVICGASVQHRDTEKGAFLLESIQHLHKRVLLGSEERRLCCPVCPAISQQLIYQERVECRFTHPGKQKGFPVHTRSQMLPLVNHAAVSRPLFPAECPLSGWVDTFMMQLSKDNLLYCVGISQMGTVHTRLQLVNCKHKVPGTHVLGAV